MSLFPKKSNFGYKFQEGQLWLYPTLYAPFDFSVKKTDFQYGNDSADKTEFFIHKGEIIINNEDIISKDKLLLLNSLKENHKLVVTFEDGIVEGGYGQTVASYLGNTELKVQNYGINKKFYDRYNVEELMKENGLTVENIVENIIESL